MKQYLAIVKLQLKNLLKIDKTKSKNFYIGIFIVLGLLYIMVMGALLTVIVQADSFIPSIWDEVANEVVALLFAFSAIIVVLFGIVSMLNVLYFSRDTEFFLALPVKPGTVFAAKFTVIYLTELVLSALLLLPTLIALGFVAEMPVFYFCTILPGILLAPSIPLVLASILAIPLMFVVGFFKNKGALTSVVVLVLFGAFFGAYFYFAFQMQSTAMDPGGLGGMNESDIAALYDGIRSAVNVVFPYLAFARFASLTPVFGLDPGLSVLVNFALSFGIVAALIAMAIFVSSLMYARGAAAQLESTKKKTTGKEQYAQSGVLKTLALREWKTLIRTPYFSFQCLMPLFISPLMVGFMASLFQSELTNALAEDGGAIMDSNVIWFISIAMIFMMGVGMNLAAPTAFTREGKAFYVMKTIPVDIKTQIRAKISVYMLISVVSIVLSAAVLMFFSPNLLYFVLTIVVLSAYAYGFNSFAVLFDLRRPKLDWVTPTEAMKQNFNIMIPLFINMGVGMGLLIVVIALSLLEGIAGMIAIWIIYAVLATVSAILFPRLLNSKAEKYFFRLS